MAEERLQGQCCATDDFVESFEHFEDNTERNCCVFAEGEREPRGAPVVDHDGPPPGVL